MHAPAPQALRDTLSDAAAATVDAVARALTAARRESGTASVARAATATADREPTVERTQAVSGGREGKGGCFCVCRGALSLDLSCFPPPSPTGHRAPAPTPRPTGRRLRCRPAQREWSASWIVRETENQKKMADADAAAHAALTSAATALATPTPATAAAAYTHLDTMLAAPHAVSRPLRRRLEAVRLRVGAAAGVGAATLLRVPPSGDLPPGAVSAAFRKLAGFVHPDKHGGSGDTDAGAAFRVLVAATETIGARCAAARGHALARAGPGQPFPSGAEWWTSWASDDSDDGAVDAGAMAEAAVLSALSLDDLRAEVKARAAAVFDDSAPGTQTERGLRLTAARAALAARLAATAGRSDDEARRRGFV